MERAGWARPVPRLVVQGLVSTCPLALRGLTASSGVTATGGSGEWLVPSAVDRGLEAGKARRRGQGPGNRGWGWRGADRQRVDGWSVVGEHEPRSRSVW